MFKHTECITPENIDTLDLTSFREHISDLQNVHSRETTKGVQIACQIDFDFEGPQKQLKCAYSLTQPFKILLIASLAFQICVATTLFILYLNNFFPSTHYLFKAIIILPIFGLLTFMVMKASFDENVKVLSGFIQVELKKHNHLQSR